MSGFEDIPVGFGMALTSNPNAMKYFTALNSAEKQVIVEQTHNIGSAAEMRRYVQNLAHLNTDSF